MAATNTHLWQYDGSYGVNSKGQRVLAPTAASYAASEADRERRHQQAVNAHKRLVRFGQVASIAPFAMAGGAALAGSGAAAGAGGGAGAGAAGVGAGAAGAGAGTGAGMTLGNMWNFANLGVGAASSYFGQRSQNRALDKQMQMQRDEINARMAADAEARAEAKRQFDAQQANETRRFAADDEERAFQRRLVEEREARMAPYRAAADRARQRLAAFLGLG